MATFKTTPTKVPQLPDVPADAPPSIKQWMSDVKEAFEIRLGRRGDQRDRAVTLRELIDSGLAKDLTDRPWDPNSDGSIDFTAIEHYQGPEELAVPPTPTSLTASAGLTKIILSWTTGWTVFSNHSLTEIWRSSTNALGDAVIIGTTSAGLFTDNVDPLTTYYYWVRFVSTTGVIGPYSNSATATAGQVSSTFLADNAVIAAKIADGTIAGTKFASSIKPVEIVNSLPTAGTQGRVVFLTTDNKLYRDTGSAWTAAVPTSDLSGSIATSALSGTIATSQIGDDAVTAAKMANNAVTADVVAASAITTTKIADDAISTAKIAANAITASEIAANAVTSNEIAANTIVAGDIASGTITTTQIASNTIVAGDIASNTLTSGQIAANAITASEIATDAVTAGKVVAGAISASELAAGAVTAGKLAAGAIVAGDGVIGSAVIQTAMVDDAAITTAKIGTSEITTALINDASITTAKINTAAITAAKIATAQINTGHLTNLYAHKLTGDVSKSTSGSLASSIDFDNELDNNAVYGWFDVLTLSLPKPTHSAGWTPYANFNINRVETDKNSWYHAQVEMAVWNVNSVGTTSTETATSDASPNANGTGFTGATIYHDYLQFTPTYSNSNATLTISSSVFLQDVNSESGGMSALSPDLIAGNSAYLSDGTTRKQIESFLPVTSGGNITGYTFSYEDADTAPVSGWSGNQALYFSKAITSGNTGPYVRKSLIDWIAVDTAYNDFTIAGVWSDTAATQKVTHGVKARLLYRSNHDGSWEQDEATMTLHEATGILMGVR